MSQSQLSSRRGRGGALISELRLQGRILRSLVGYAHLAARMRWSQEKLQTFQQARLKDALERAASHVPFYKARCPTDVTDLHRWPLTTRHDLQTTPVAQLLDEEVSPGDCSVLTTSGSTGEPLRVCYTQADLQLRWLYFVRMFRAYNLEFICRLAEIGQYKTSRAFIPGQRWSVDQRSFISVRDPVDARLELMARSDPEAIIGYTSDLSEMAARSCARGLSFPSLRVVIGVGETMGSVERKNIRDGWAVDAYDSYGAVEVGNIAFECPHRSGGYHIHSDYLLVEVLRADGSPAMEGEIGEVVVTALSRRAMPMVRYQLGDLAALGPPCRCGSALPILEQLRGRNDDVITLSSGRRLTPQAVIRVFCGSGIRRYRLRQHAAGRFTLEIDGNAEAVACASRGFQEILEPGDHLEVIPVTLSSGRSNDRTIVVEAS